jgi:LmbE family N-acetylglucosaminyl deacetylase
MSNILIISPHPDDDILGTGGTIDRHIKEGDDVYLIIATDYGKKDEIKEATKIYKKVFKLGFADECLDTVNIKVIADAISRVINQVKPETVYVCHRDVNQDHRAVFDATMIATRPKPGCPVKYLYAYETLSSTEWNFDNSFVPDYFVEIDYQVKYDMMSKYKSEVRQPPHPRSGMGIMSLSGHRGNTVGVTDAEAFMLIRGINCIQNSKTK